MMPPASPTRHPIFLALNRNGRVRDEAALDRLAQRARGATDCFVFCHGWLHDEAHARHEAVRFFALLDGALLALGDRVRPLRVALHWPSLPFASIDGRSAEGGGLWPALERQVTGGPLGLSFDAGRLLLDLCTAEVPRSPEEEVELSSISRRLEHEAQRGGLPASMLQALSFWTMKRRAGDVGEHLGREVLGPLWNSLPSPRPRLHLIGHSFGAKLVTSAVLGGVTPESLTLLLGAFSAFSFAPEVPGFDRPGFYHPVLADGRVRGRIAVLHSAHDRALGVLYPRLGSQVDRDVPADGLGHHGARGVARSALGAIGARGVGAPGLSLMEAQAIGLPQRSIVNIDGSGVVKAEAPFVGAHHDIHHPEIATLVLLAAGLLEGGPEGVRAPRAQPLALA
jgi:hypothetical protein